MYPFPRSKTLKTLMKMNSLWNPLESEYTQPLICSKRLCRPYTGCEKRDTQPFSGSIFNRKCLNLGFHFSKSFASREKVTSLQCHNAGGLMQGGPLTMGGAAGSSARAFWALHCKEVTVSRLATVLEKYMPKSKHCYSRFFR